MPFKKNLLKILSLIFILSSSYSAQTFYVSVADTFRVNLENHYRLSALSIVPGSEKLLLNKKRLTYNDYSISYDSNTVSLSDSLNYSLLDTLIVVYKAVKIPLKKEYYNQTLVKVYDKKIGDTVTVLKRNKFRLTNEAIFGSKIKKSGTLVRGITIGTNQGATVNSGLRLELSGKLSDEIEIVAALTDQNSPIQPEGVTERLREVDKVFIELRHKYGKATFGDYYLNKNLGEFLKLNRKLQGLKVEGNYNKYSAVAAFASQKGKYTTNKFFGQDGVQGPYRLYGENNEKNIIVIAGTERVYLNGQKMVRGEQNDYVIDYANATITFKTRRIINSTSRIFVEFEYTDRKFPRTFWGGSASANELGGKLSITASYFRESDNENNPIDFQLSSEDIEIIRNAGGDPLKAVKSGVRLAPYDSVSGKRNGLYVKIDTLINGENFSYYKYEPTNPTAEYLVYFSYVGAGKGDYEQINIKEYKFVGIKQGSYLPIIFLPLPQKKEVADFHFDYSPLDGLNLLGEFSASNFDRNKLSLVDNEKNTGAATNFEIEYKKNKNKIFGINVGGIETGFKNRFINERFNPLERIDNVEFKRNYNIADSATGNQLLQEVHLKLQPVENFEIGGNYGRVKYGENFISNRYRFLLSTKNESKYKFRFYNNYVSSKSFGLKSYFLEQKGNLFYSIWKLKPGINYLRDKKTESISANVISPNSHDYLEVEPYLEFRKYYGITASVKYKLRKEKSPLENKLSDEAELKSTSIEFAYRNIREFTTTLSLAFQKKKYTEAFKNKGFKDNETILIRSRTQLNLFKNFLKSDFYYNTATEKAAKLQRIFLPVPPGTGNYIYLGDLNGNGIADEDEFSPTADGGDFIVTTIPTDKLYPVISLQANARLRFDFSKLFKYKSFWKTILSPISTETFFRVDEKSKVEQTEKIYFMNPHYFLNDSTTINGGQQFRNDIYLFRTSGKFSVRARFYQKKRLSQYSQGLEKSYYREKSLRVRTRLTRDIRNQTDYAYIDDYLVSASPVHQSRKATTQKIYSDFSYRPYPKVEVGFKFGVGRVIDKFPATPSQIDFNSELVRVNFSFVNHGRLRIEIERKELSANVQISQIPFEITQGNSLGKNYFLRINLDYKLSNNIQTTLSYTGKKYASSDIIHLLRAEARAYF